jgi:hypothetical protein
MQQAPQSRLIAGEDACGGPGMLIVFDIGQLKLLKIVR